MGLLPHPHAPFGGLKPAFPVVMHTIEPVLAGSRRLAGLRQTFLFGRSRCRGFWRRGIDTEEVGQRIRGCRGRREPRQQKSGEPKSQMTGHGIPPVLRPARVRPLAATWVAMRPKSDNARDSLRHVPHETPHADFVAKIRVPPVMHFQPLPDMGGMNGQWAPDGAHQGLIVADRCQTDGAQAGRGRTKNLATTLRHKSVAESHCRCQIQRRHRGYPNAGKPRRLITSSPKIPHSLKSRLA